MPPSDRPLEGRRAILLTVAGSLLVAGLLLAVAVAALLARERNEALSYWSEQLEVAAHLRQAAIESWLEERREDLLLVGQFPTVNEVLEQRSRHAEEHLTPILRNVARSHHLDWVRLADDGNRTIVVQPEAASITEADLEVARRALDTGQAALASRRRSPTSELLVTFAAPAAPPDGGTKPLGVVQVGVPAGEWLSALLASFGAPHRTAEALLAIEEAGQLVFVTPLRHAEAPPFGLVRSLDTPELAAAAALAGKQTTGIYRDYRGVRVLATPRRIVGAPWVLVVKVDLEEVFEGYRSERAAILVGAVSMLIAVAALALLFGQRRVARERLARSEAAREALRQRDAIAEAVPAYLMELDAAGRVLYANRPLAGASLREIEGHPLLDRLPEAVRPRMAEVLERAFAGETQQLEIALRDAADEARDLLATLSPYRVGSERRVLVSAVDVTATRRAERELSQSETRLRAFFDSNVVGILEGDIHGAVFAANDEFLRIVGYDRDELAAGTVRWTELTPPEFLPRDERAIEEARARGACTAYEKQYQRKDGQRVWVLVGFALLAPERERSVAFVFDISERKRVEEELRRLYTAIEQADEAVLLTDTVPHIEYVNPAFERVTGYKREEVVGKNPRLLNSGKHSRAFYRDMWERLTRGETWRGRLVNRRKDGALFEEEATISPIVDDAGVVRHYVAVKRDLARERRLELELEKTRRLEALGRLAGGIAHDFNNALSVVLGYAERLREGFTQNDPRRESVIEILRAADGARGLTRQLLAFSRQRSGDERPLDLNAAVRELAHLFQPLLGETIALELSLAENIGWVRFDPARLDQVVSNLLLNARDAMPRGGKLEIATAEVERTGVEPGGLPAGRYLWLSVRDDGAGMSPETLERAFEPFFTTKAEGTGLGLATVYGLVQEAGGRVSIDSAPNAGTRVEILLPRIEPALPARDRPSDAPVREGPRTTAAGRILVVEDQESLRRLVRITLERLGYEVTTAADATEAGELARAAASFDLLLTDVVLPGATGPELAAELVEVQPELRVLFVSGYPNGGRGPAGPDELSPLLPKPFSAAELAAAVRAALDGPPFAKPAAG